MADISLELIGRQLQNIQAELREMKFSAEVERRNNRSAFEHRRRRRERTAPNDAWV